PKCNRIIVFYGYVAFSVGKKCEMSFCCRETVDITSKTVQKKQDSCIYESCFVAVNHGYFPMMPYVAFTFRFNEDFGANTLSRNTVQFPKIKTIEKIRENNKNCT
ncbi:MAG: hypothetical protein K2P44_12970, partial [Lachnospiraceae bacterium]|nr:hypothetical protein [Lachnospiraceae bacterium]